VAQAVGVRVPPSAQKKITLKRSDFFYALPGLLSSRPSVGSAFFSLGLSPSRISLRYSGSSSCIAMSVCRFSGTGNIFYNATATAKSFHWLGLVLAEIILKVREEILLQTDRSIALLLLEI
jgi:hypothetical protein